MSVVDYRTFATRFAARTDRWGLMLEFLRDWNHPWEGAEPVASEDIARAEERLGFPLPVALREWYQLPFNPFFLNRRLFWTHLVTPEKLTVWPEGAATNGLVVFMQEYQQCCEWAFLARDAQLPDPPFYHGDTEDDETPAEEWALQSATFSGFFLQLLMLRTVYFGRLYAAVKKQVDEAVWPRVAEEFTDLGFPVWLEYGKDCRLLGGRDCLLAIRSDPPWGQRHDLYLAARTGEALDRVTELLGVEWGCVEDARKAQSIA